MTAPPQLNSDALFAYVSWGTVANLSVILGPHVAWDSVLSSCAKSYSSCESLGFFEESITDTSDQPDWDNTAESIVVINNPSFTVPSTHLTNIGLGNRTFIVSDVAQFTLHTSLVASLQGSGGIDVTGNMQFERDINQGIYYQLANKASLPVIVQNIAHALTNSLRVLSNQYVEGTALADEVFIHVQWPWLILPLIMMLLAVAFLSLTVWQSHCSRVPYWRSSVLAVMEHGVNTYHPEGLNDDRTSGMSSVLGKGAGNETAGDLEVWAEGVTVRLRGRGPMGTAFGLTVT